LSIISINCSWRRRDSSSRASICSTVSIPWGGWGAGQWRSWANLRGLRLLYRCVDLSHNHGKNLTLPLIFKIFVGASTPTTIHVASPLVPVVSHRFSFPFRPGITHPIHNMQT
jgi:hypothetical protein